MEQMKIVSYQDINKFLSANPDNSNEQSTIEVQDQGTVEVLLTKPSFKKNRRGYGYFVNGVMVAYAIVMNPPGVLDLLYTAPSARRKGYTERFLRQLPITEVVVEETNIGAVKLYKKLGYSIDYALEGYSYKP